MPDTFHANTFFGMALCDPKGMATERMAMQCMVIYGFGVTLYVWSRIVVSVIDHGVWTPHPLGFDPFKNSDQFLSHEKFIYSVYI